MLHIFSTAVINKIIAMLTNIVIVRVLTKDEFGYFSYAYNIVLSLVAFSGLGTPNTILQYGCEAKNNKEWLRKEKTLVLVGLTSSFIFSLGTLLYALFIPLSIPEGRDALIILSFLPMAQYLFSYFSMKLRVLEKNKWYAMIMNLQSISYFIAACLGGYLFSLFGTTVGRYVGYLVPVLVGFWLLRKEMKEVSLARITKNCIEEIKYSLWVISTNASSSVFYYFGVWVIGIVISDAGVLADYKVATQIPTALLAIPVSFATFIYPKFVRKQDDAKWILKNYHLVQLGLGGLNLLITVGCIVLSPYIIGILYGAEYSGAVYPFCVLMVSYFISATFRNPTGHVLSMLHQVKANFYLGLIGCTVNIVVSFIMISRYGGIGAAYTTLIVTVIESLSSSVYLYSFLRKKAKKNVKEG